MHPAAWAQRDLLRENLLFVSQKRKTSPEQMSSQDRQLTLERRRAHRKREVELLHQRELQALKIEEDSTQKVRDMCLTESSIPHSLLLLDRVCVHSLSAVSLTHESREC